MRMIVLAGCLLGGILFLSGCELGDSSDRSDEERAESEADGEASLRFQDALANRTDAPHAAEDVAAATAVSARMSIWRDSCTNYWTLVYATNDFCRNHGWSFANDWHPTYYCGGGTYHKMWFNCYR